MGIADVACCAVRDAAAPSVAMNSRRRMLIYQSRAAVIEGRIAEPEPAVLTPEPAPDPARRVRVTAGK
jgi:hypothetical protein